MSLCRKMASLKFLLTLSLIVFSMLSLTSQDARESKKKYSSWKEIVQDMEVHLNVAFELYKKGENKAAYDEVDVAYFRFYESKGMEKTTMAYISGARKNAVEGAFYEYRRNVRSDKDVHLVEQHKDLLIAMLYQDAKELDGDVDDETVKEGGAGHKRSPAVVAFITSFSLVLREGLEAILVIAAIIVYLIKTGKKKYVGSVYIGGGAGIIVSMLLAWIFYMVKQRIGDVFGAVAQEAFEGFGMFIAVVVLFYVSNWMLSKSEAEAWERYIRKKVESSVTLGNRLVLIFAAFIAVAREGAELILFFQGVQINSGEEKSAIIWGIVASLALLAVVFLIFRFLTVRLPLKPFFIVTSLLMYAMCISFTGKGVEEFQEAGWITRTPVTWMGNFEIDLLGVYATYESIIPQFIILLIIVALAVFYNMKGKKDRKIIKG